MSDADCDWALGTKKPALQLAFSWLVPEKSKTYSAGYTVFNIVSFAAARLPDSFLRWDSRELRALCRSGVVDQFDIPDHCASRSSVKSTRLFLPLRTSR